MRIDLDTYKDGRLHYGPNGGEQRQAVWEWRWDSFISLFKNKYPEMIIVFGKINYNKSLDIIGNIHSLEFKYSNKLGYSLKYNLMEIVTNDEFKHLLRRFSNYLRCSQEKEKIVGLMKS